MAGFGNLLNREKGDAHITVALYFWPATVINPFANADGTDFHGRLNHRLPQAVLTC